ncbi:sensor histidine kinase [Alteromonas halophila]|uniref:Two-component sensor histidine kinase n=1 Tax=Alteromonas halophila TaxID=516698 RepID=A0A918JEN3_9ALTE|nr:sensor histidine kinase [Alteromonas halophila]GGW75273.1 two-component sensor histidine kinase [Alteromonas halophila]
MKIRTLPLATETLVAFFTWLLVAGSALALTVNYAEVTDTRWWLSMCAYCGFITGFFLGVRDGAYRHELLVRYSLMGWQCLCVIILYLCLPFSYNAILMTMLSAQLVYYMSLHRAILLSPLWSAPLWLTQYYVWQESTAWLTALLFWTFNIFAMMMVDSRRREEQARKHAEETNRELRAAQALLQRATREQERTRIARNIHDLLGHHLTALSIHLQVAGRLSSNPERDKDALSSNLSQCHNIARLLLQDVRDAVSDMRESEGVSLQEAIDVLIRDVPSLAIETRITDNLPELSFTQANAVIRTVQEAITNTLRHARASVLTVDITCRDGMLTVIIEDNGRVEGELNEGHGLRGIRERIADVNGSLTMATTPALQLTIKMPVNL